MALQPHHHHHEHSHTHSQRRHPSLPQWLSVEEALAKVLSYVDALEAQDVPLLEALGLVLAEDVRASFDVPPHANSAMDGYAVQSGSIQGASEASPRVLKVIGQVAAGQMPTVAAQPGTAVRIMTGAPIPPGADCVVPFEDTDEMDRRGHGPIVEIGVQAPLLAGANIREAGEDITRGDLALVAGTTLRPSEIGVLASMGKRTARVVRRPVVAILATGDELVEPGEPLSPGKIYNSNGYSIAASVLKYGGIPQVLGIARDNLESLVAKIEEGLSSDMLLTSAGVSRGDYDIVKDVLAKKGEIAFWTVRMRPAKPLAFGALRHVTPDGRVRRVPHLGLPGNPVSSLVAFEELARPAMLKMMGKTKLDKPTIQAVLEDSIENTDGRRVYARVRVYRRDGSYYARLAGNQSSGALTSMSKANGLAICPEDLPRKAAGETVQVQMLDWSEEVAL